MRTSPEAFYASPAYGRRPNLDVFRAHLRLHFPEAGGALIVEVGGMRSPGNVDGDGCASVAWAQHAEECGATFVSIDVDRSAVEATRLLNASGLSVVAVCADGTEVLRALRTPVLLLYLDGADDAQQTVAQFIAAEALIPVHGLVVVDDQHVKGPALAQMMASMPGWGALAGLDAACNQLAWERLR